MTQIAYKRSGRRSNRPDNELLAELYKIHTAEEIAQMYGVATDTARAWIRKARQEEKKKE